MQVNVDPDLKYCFTVDYIEKLSSSTIFNFVAIAEVTTVSEFGHTLWYTLDLIAHQWSGSGQNFPYHRKKIINFRF
jgi:hypothetical protein